MADEAGIPSVPSGSPKEITGWMTAVRTRLLGIKNQFTDSEATKLRALLNASPQSTATVAAPTIVFLAAPANLYWGTGNASWSAVNVSNYGVPATAKAVIIQTRWHLLSNVGTEDRWAALRVDQSRGNGSEPISDTFVLAEGNRGGDGSTAANSQGVYPVVNGSFEYTSARSGYGWSEIVIQIVGYIV